MKKILFLIIFLMSNYSYSFSIENCRNYDSILEKKTFLLKSDYYIKFSKFNLKKVYLNEDDLYNSLSTLNLVFSNIDKYLSYKIISDKDKKCILNNDSDKLKDLIKNGDIILS